MGLITPFRLNSDHLYLPEKCQQACKSKEGRPRANKEVAAVAECDEKSPIGMRPADTDAIYKESPRGADT